MNIRIVPRAIVALDGAYYTVASHSGVFRGARIYEPYWEWHNSLPRPRLCQDSNMHLRLFVVPRSPSKQQNKMAGWLKNQMIFPRA